MADAQEAAETTEESKEPALEAGNYEVIRARLVEQGERLRGLTESLNEKRKGIFGGQELSVVATENIRTTNNCVPRDIVQASGLLVMGFEVHMGRRDETSVGDVFALHNFSPKDDGHYDCSDAGLEAVPGFLEHEQFVKDFSTLFRFNRDARLLKLTRTDTQLLAMFQSGTTIDEVKGFNWRIQANGAVEYVDDRGERSHKRPHTHDFEWFTPSVEDTVEGRHIKIKSKGKIKPSSRDEIFISNLEGKLRVILEDNTPEGNEVYSYDLEDGNQVLIDLKVRYAEVGSLFILEVIPFRENVTQYIVVNVKSETAERLDAVGLSCQQLPENHGIIFPGGYVLETGEFKLFPADDTFGLEFRRKIASPNGEDVLYIYHRRDDGHYVLFPYNLIRKEVGTPIHCHGYSLFDDGRMVVFRALSEEPTTLHKMQVWQTPFTSAAFAAAAPTDGSFLANVGNAELVRGISDVFTVHRFIRNAEPTRQIFDDLIATTTRCLDAYYWLDHEETGNIKAVLDEIRGTADLIIDEFEKVIVFKKEAQKAITAIEAEFVEATRDIREGQWKRIDPFLEALTTLRGLRGKVITLRELRYMDLERLGEVENQTIERFDEVSQACVKFLLEEDAFAPLKEDLEGTLESLDEVEKVADVIPLKERIDTTSEGLDLLSQVVADLKIDDATKRTTILEGISEVFAQLNRVRATIEGRRKDLLGQEGRAEFAAQFALLGQSVSSALALSNDPEKCDEQLSRVMVQLQELEGRFSEFDEFLGDLAAKREEIYDAFTAKKQQLNDERQQRIGNIAGAIDRIIEGIERRSRQMKSQDELNAYFASDAMVMKVRDLCDQLVELGDSVKADSYLAKLASARQNALRGLRDKLELFEDGDNIIKFGRHRFSVNTQALELAMVPRDGKIQIHLNGTDYYAAVTDERFAATKRFWGQNLVSENDEVYRGEFLAAEILDDAEQGHNDLNVHRLHELLRDGELGELTKKYTQERYDEGYDRGLHDADAALILEKLITLREAAGLLRFPPTPRALACLFWSWYDAPEDKERWHLQAKNLGRLRSTFGHATGLTKLATEVASAIRTFLEDTGITTFPEADADPAASYLTEELVADRPGFVTSGDALKLRENLLSHVQTHGDRRAFDDDFRALEERLRERFALAHAWVEAYLDHPDRQDKRHLALEAAVLLCEPATGPRRLDRNESAAVVEAEVSGLLGQHRRIDAQKMQIRIDEFMERLTHFRLVEAPAYREYRKLRHEILEFERKSLRLEELMPKVMTAFVRNRLINEVYLPLIGDNLAKQIGAAGEGKRTDLMGLLLLISPPGYGKTTLMEYIANRLGLVFVKVNGPSLGHSVVSLDPAEAPNATSRQEVEKINLAFEMGNNVMLYLDDIQHTHPELLQKFISLCDGQRRIEGVWRGRTQTYDMRGRKFCVVMAGNPYTETGDKFTIPDMLANRADTYNLGDILDGKAEAFALSYIENALTSNPVLQPLATREQSDVYKLIRRAQGEELPATDLTHGYSAVELNEIETVFRHMFRVQDVLLKVNMEYIRSASQDDKFRTEPTFKLQGSYRNMNRMAEKVMSAMNDQEVEALISDHYIGESQTLTTGAENNLLKLAEMRGTLTEEEAARWKDIKEEFVRHNRMGGSADDPVARLSGVLSGLSADLSAIRDVIADNSALDDALDRGLGKVNGQLGFIRAALESGNAQSLDATIEQSVGALASQIGALRETVEAGEGLDVAIDNTVSKLTREIGTLKLAVEDSAVTGVDEAIGAGFANMSSELGFIRAALEQGATKGLDQTMAGIEQRLELIRQELAQAAEAVIAGEQRDASDHARLAAVPPAAHSPQRQPPAAHGQAGHAGQGAQGGGHGGGADLGPVLERLEAALQTVSQPKIELATTTSSEVQALLQQQTQLIEHTIVPLVQTAASRLHDSEQVMATLQQVQFMLHQMRYQR